MSRGQVKLWFAYVKAKAWMSLNDLQVAQSKQHLGDVHERMGRNEIDENLLFGSFYISLKDTRTGRMTVNSAHLLQSIIEYH